MREIACYQKRAKKDLQRDRFVREKRLLLRVREFGAYDDPLADKLAGIIKDVTGKTGKYGQMGTLPLDPVALEWGGKIVSMGVGRVAENNAHGKNESVRPTDIESMAEIITRLVTS